eukprot:6741439-Prymnesium_polylepis.2
MPSALYGSRSAPSGKGAHTEASCTNEGLAISSTSATSAKSSVPACLNRRSSSDWAGRPAGGRRACWSSRRDSGPGGWHPECLPRARPSWPPGLPAASRPQSPQSAPPASSSLAGST